MAHPGTGRSALRPLRPSATSSPITERSKKVDEEGTLFSCGGRVPDEAAFSAKPSPVS